MITRVASSAAQRCCILGLLILCPLLAFSFSDVGAQEPAAQRYAKLRMRLRYPQNKPHIAKQEQLQHELDSDSLSIGQPIGTSQLHTQANAAPTKPPKNAALYWKDKLAEELRLEQPKLDIQQQKSVQTAPKPARKAATRLPAASAAQLAQLQHKLAQLAAAHAAREEDWRKLASQWSDRHEHLLKEAVRLPHKKLDVRVMLNDDAALAASVAALPALPLEPPITPLTQFSLRPSVQPGLTAEPHAEQPAAGIHHEASLGRALPMVAPTVRLPAFNDSELDYVVFILFQQNLPMLYHSLESAVRIFPSSRVVVIDNSYSGAASASTRVADSGAQVVRTVTWLSFPQLHNLMAYTAASMNLPLYFWLHSDAVVTPRYAEQDTLGEILADLKSMLVQRHNWAVAYFFYDWLAAFNPVAVLAVPWDEQMVQNYFTDCDMYVRLQKAGWWVGNAPTAGLLRIFHLADVPPADVPVAKLTLNERHGLYEAHSKHTLKVGDEAWKERSVSELEKTASQLAIASGHAYFRSKWGHLDCNVQGIQQPNFDVAGNRLRLQLPVRA